MAHDVALLVGTLRHGLGQYKALTADKELENVVKDVMLHDDKKSICRRIAEKVEQLSTATQSGETQKVQRSTNQGDAATSKSVEDSAAVPKAASTATGTVTANTAAVPETTEGTGSWLSGLAPQKLTKRLRHLIA